VSLAGALAVGPRVPALVLALALVLAAIATAAAVALSIELRRRTEAVARACHELRGPLCAARLALAAGSRSGELTVSRLRSIDTELGRAGLALEDLGRARRRRRHGAGGLPFARVERVELGELVAGSVEAWRASAAAGGVSLRARGQPGGRGGIVWGDRLRLAQAAGNLIANAIEHGGGRVEVGVSVRRGAVRLEVTDNGPGLPASVADLCRRPRAGRGARGRGLAIAAMIAAAHGGRLSAAPSERGARLVLELPPADPAAELAGYPS
jgi:signal transduction histidine kinase